MNRALVVLIAAAGLAVAAPAAAQVPITFYFGATVSDTAVGLAPGATGTVPIRLSNPQFYSFTDYPTSVRFVVHFDPAKIAVLGAAASTSGGFTAIDSTNIGTGTAMVAASGFVYGPDADALRLVVQLQPGVTDGVYLWLETDSVQVYNWYYPPYTYHRIGARSRIGMACHASNFWGDVDGNHQVDSRDALITLSAAVGLPVSGGFDLAHGDVDGDGLTNSRDALMMLSFSIGLGTSSSGPLNRVAVGIADACPGLTPPGETVVFNRNLGGGSGGLFGLDAAATAPVQLTFVPSDQWPRLNHAGTFIVFQCDIVGVSQVCRTGADGSGRDTLTSHVGPVSQSQPDWAPGDTIIVYNAGGGYGIGRMDSTGANKSPIDTSAGIFGVSLAVSRVGDTLAITNSGHFGLYAFPFGSPLSPALDANFGSITYAAPIRWSPDGSTIATVNFNGGGILTLPRTGGVSSAPAVAPNGITAFDWGPQGVIFSMPDSHGNLSLWLLQGGFGGPLVRLTNPGTGQADDQPSFRRNP
jgi:hypothetical protein